MPRDNPQTPVQYWQWRYRDSTSGELTETTVPLTEEEASQLPEAERIEGSLLSEIDWDEFQETAPDFHSDAIEELRDHDDLSESEP